MTEFFDERMLVEWNAVVDTLLCTALCICNIGMMLKWQRQQQQLNNRTYVEDDDRFSLHSINVCVYTCVRIYSTFLVFKTCFCSTHKTVYRLKGKKQLPSAATRKLHAKKINKFGETKIQSEFKWFYILFSGAEPNFNCVHDDFINA